MEHTRIQLPGFGLLVKYYQLHGDPDVFPNSLNPNNMNDSIEDTCIGAVTVYTGHVVKSDAIVPESLKLECKLPW